MTHSLYPRPIHKGEVFTITAIAPGQFELVKRVLREFKGQELVETPLGIHPNEAKARQRMMVEIRRMAREATRRQDVNRRQ